MDDERLRKLYRSVHTVSPDPGLLDAAREKMKAPRARGWVLPAAAFALALVLCAPAARLLFPGKATDSAELEIKTQHTAAVLEDAGGAFPGSASQAAGGTLADGATEQAENGAGYAGDITAEAESAEEYGGMEEDSPLLWLPEDMSLSRIEASDDGTVSYTYLPHGQQYPHGRVLVAVRGVELPESAQGAQPSEEDAQLDISYRQNAGEASLQFEAYLAIDGVGHRLTAQGLTQEEFSQVLASAAR